MRALLGIFASWFDWPTWLRLSVFHLGFLAAVTSYAWIFFPNQRAITVAFALAALVGELISLWRRVFVAEALLVIAAIAAYSWWHPTAREEWHAYLGMLMAAWLLVPSRIGWLRWLVPLAALEVLYLGINGDSPALVVSACAMLVPIAIAALAADAWLVAISGARASARSRPPPLSMLRWAALPAALAIAVGVTVGGFAHSARPLTPGGQHGPDAKTGLNQTPRIGEPGHVSRDPTIAARLNWQGAQPPPGMVYLRAWALDHVRCNGDLVEWQADHLDELTPVARRAPPADALCWLYRAAGGTDIVFRPDANTAVDLDQLLGDPDGNLYRVGIGEGPKVYRCGITEEARPAPGNAKELYLQWHERLNYVPWQDIIAGQPWLSQRAEDAAQGIAAAIQSRCQYSLDLPEPMHGGGGAIRTFLFDSDPKRRVGHCQYYATAEVLLLRLTSHPARFVEGFASDERDEQGVTFRGLHAHAWAEYVDSEGHWRRIDPTPADGLHEIRDRLAPDEPLPPVSQDPINTAIGETTKAEARGPRLRSLALQLVPVAAIALVLVWFIRRWWRRRHLDPRRIELERRADDLFTFARGLGVRVTPASTVATISVALERKTGIDLQRWRDAHLAARYGTGPVPEEWPYQQMRAAMKRRIGV
jgi:hypothetical protein